MYSAGLVQGLVLVSPAAAGQVLRPAIGDERYGAIFLPLVIGAIVGALSAPAVEARVGATGALRFGFVLNVIGAFSMAASALVLDSPTPAFVVLCLACALIGVGFGLSIAALNLLAIRLFPGRSAAAVATLHVTLGIGSVIGPIAIGVLAGVGSGDGIWWLVPLAAAAGALAVLTALAGIVGMPSASALGRIDLGRLPGRLLGYAAIVVVYGAIEALFINWSTIYVREDLSGSDAQAGFALALFFGVMAVGRLIFAFASLRRPLRFLLVASPIAAVGAFVLMGWAESPGVALAAASLAGLAMAPFFVYMLSLAVSEFPEREATVSGLMMAALMGGGGTSALVVGLIRADVDLSLIFTASAVISLAVGAAVLAFRPGRALVR